MNSACRLKGYLAAFVVTLLAILPSHAKADNATLRSADNSIWGSFGASFFNYKEPSTSPYLPDSEKGTIPSLAGGVNFLTDSNLYVGLEGSVNFGDATYNGAYFAYPTVPLQGTTTETITYVDGRVGEAFPMGGNVMLIPYVEIGFRYWDRNLGGGDSENYQNFDTLGGVMLQVSPIQRLILSGYLSAGSTISPQMQTGGETYDLGTSGVYRIGGKVGFDLTKRVELFTTLDYDHFNYGQSSVQADGTYEPNSRTEDTTMRVGLAYHFR